VITFTLEGLDCGSGMKEEKNWIGIEDTIRIAGFLKLAND
jgi:hypothetical protein